MRLLFYPLVSAMAVFGCSDAADPTYTLYRNSSLDPALRVHVATFDTSEGGAVNPYNRLQCEEIAELMTENDSEQKRWWCERGRFRP